MTCQTPSMQAAPGNEFLTNREWPTSTPQARVAVTRDGSLRTLRYDLEDGGEIEIIIDSPLTQVTHHAILRVFDFTKLPNNWDSYGASRISPEVAVAALNFLLNVLPTGLPKPCLVPTPAGGIQFEWHSNSVDLEIEIQSNELISVSFSDLRTGVDEDEVIRDNFQPLAHMFNRLMN